MNEVKKEYPELEHKQIVSVISQLWGQMNAEERRAYEDAYNREMQVYEKDLDIFYAKHPEERPKNYNKQRKQ
jgi:hypothetical protein